MLENGFSQIDAYFHTKISLLYSMFYSVVSLIDLVRIGHLFFFKNSFSPLISVSADSMFDSFKERKRTGASLAYVKKKKRKEKW